MDIGAVQFTEFMTWFLELSRLQDAISSVTIMQGYTSGAMRSVYAALRQANVN